jgi:serine/threonine protein kinase
MNNDQPNSQHGAGTSSSRADAASLASTQLDYELLRLIGKGSYGEVWLARERTGAYRAVKVVFRASFDHDRPYEREYEGIRKFEPVSRSYENQVQILHVGRQDAAGRFYYIMELADDQRTGQEIDPSLYAPKTLKSELKRLGRFPVKECLRIGVALAGALENLHAHGLIHRDIKPANIIFVNDVPKLADIGLVTDRDVSVSYVGTEGYIPPEGPSSAQADIFSLGKVLYEMATGRDRMDFPELPTNLEEFPDRETLLELNTVIAKTCERDWKRRYQAAREMLADLAGLQRGQNIRKRRLWSGGVAVAGKAGALVVLLGLALWGSYRGWKWVSKGLSDSGKRGLTERNQSSSTDAFRKALNLLPLIDSQQDAVAGTWQVITNALVTDIAFVSRLELPYEPPEEYDFRITFTRLDFEAKERYSGWGDAFQLLAKDGEPFAWYMGAHGNTWFGFDLVGGKRFDTNPTGVRVLECLHLDRRYTAMVSVRKESVQAFLDGKLISEWRPNQGALSEGPYLTRRNKQALGLGACNVRTVFHSIEVREVTGHGRFTRSPSSTPVPAPAPPPSQFAAQTNATSLFNGRDVAGWDLREPAARKNSWSVRNGMLVNKFTDANHSSDLVSTASYKDFTLHYEYRIGPRANSGVCLRGCYELQILDDQAQPNLPANEKNGALWKLAAPLRSPAGPLNQWQEVLATVKGDRLTVTLNGVIIHDNLLLGGHVSRHGGIDSHPDGSGPIVLQGRLGSVEFRNLWIKPLN